MYCPDCGSQNSAAQRFCRSCGLALEKISQSLAEQRPTKLDGSLQQRKEKLEKLGVAALSVFGVSIVAFIGYVLFFKLLASQSPFWAAFITLAVLIVVGCGLLSVFLFAKANELKEAPANRQIDTQGELSARRTTSELLTEGHPDQMFSVTERTTDLLKVEKKT
jgi:hypothetical protein